MPTAKRYEVHHLGQLVLSFSAEPGHLMSTAARPQGFTPPPHPFVNAQAHDAGHEQRLAQLLQQAGSVEELMGLLTQHGYVVTAL